MEIAIQVILTKYVWCDFYDKETRMYFVKGVYTC